LSHAGYSFGALVAIAAVARVLLPIVVRRFTRDGGSRELMTLFAIVMACAGAWLASLANWSWGLGSFIAGLLLSQTDLRHQIRAEITPFRDAFNALFFISIGTMVDFNVVASSTNILLLLIVLYKLGDAFAGSLTTAFLIRGVGFTPTDVGAINKGLGLAATIFGALFGGMLMVKLRLYRALMAFGILQAVSNLSFMWLAAVGKSYPIMVLAVAFENLAGGMGTAAFVALLMAMCDLRYSATQYALLSALAAIGRVYVGPAAGYIVDAAGWTQFFFITFLAALPGLNVAVRSSALSEDGAACSMAGQLETFLDVRREDVPEKVRACWAGLCGPAVLAYAAKHGMAPATEMGVIVQRQIHPRYAGVLFTLDPRS
jgi:hypothetical protein